MNYESMSDHEVNSAVTCVVFDCKEWICNDVEFYHCGLDGGGYYSQPIIDFCDSPSSAWPILSGSKISIAYRDHTSLAPVAKRFGSNSHNIAHANPLRAAMFVFLMIQND